MTARDPSRHTCHITGKDACTACARHRPLAADEYADSAPHVPIWSDADRALTPDQYAEKRRVRVRASHRARGTASRLAATRRGGDGDKGGDA